MAGFAPVPPPTPVVPSPSILTVAGRLVDVDWREGVAWRALCQRADVWPQCQTDPTAEKCAADPRPLVEVTPFWVYLPAECDYQMRDEESVLAALNAATAHHVGAALWMGAGLPAGHIALREVAQDVSAPVAVDPLAAIATLLANWERCAQRGGAVLHVPSILIPGLIERDVVWQDGPVYRGPLGALVSPGPGYPQGVSTTGPGGFGPQTTPGNYLGNAADEAWMYVSGPVEVALGDVRGVEASDRRTNVVNVIAERQALVRFDPCCVFAVLVEVPSP